MKPQPPRRRHVIRGVAGAGIAWAMPERILAALGTPEPRGQVAPGYEDIREAFALGQANDAGGAQLCVYHHGRKVVDLWTGRDVVRGRSYGADTINTVFSCGKGMIALCAHMLSQRGLLDLDAPVATYWPEFAAQGKARIPVSYLLSHRAGLANFPVEARIGQQELLDWDRCTAALAAMAPLWEPGTAFRYHALTYGYLVGEVIRRVSGKSPGEFFADHVASPLGLDLWIGLPPDQEPRVAPAFGDKDPSPGEIAQRLARAGVDMSLPIVRAEIARPGMAILNTRAGRAAEVPAANGVGDARSLARMYAATIGPVDDLRLLNGEAMNRARRIQTSGLGSPPPFSSIPEKYPLSFAMGYMLDSFTVPMLGPGSFGHAGRGGRLGFADPTRGIAAGYVCNAMTWNAAEEPDPRWSPWTQALAKRGF